MRITHRPDVPLHNMIRDIASDLRIEYLEFVSYDPADSYDSQPRVRLTMTPYEFQNRTIDSIRDQICENDNYVLGLSSIVRVVYSTFHLPQIDFSCEVGEENEKRIYNFLGRLNQKDGYLLESGRSYHFLGRDLMPADFWRGFMKTLDAMDFDGLVDDDFIYESDVNRGFSVLRITANIHKPHVPKVIAEIKDDQLKLFPRPTQE
ncbi:MAG TPA: hypothetical protein VJH04_01575 [archaeon]|nr:hypothetical protein [archaeon]